MKQRSARKISGRGYLLATACAVFILLLLVIYAFLHAGAWLVSEDPLEKSQAVLVLSGGLPDRALAAAQIYRNGYAKEVWLTQPLQPGAAMKELQLPYAGEEEYSRMVLIAKGVPPEAIHILKPRILNTADELQAVAAALDEQPGRTAIVVTSKSHTRRVQALWKQISTGHRGRLIVRAAPDDYFDASHWWRTTSDALNVVREYLGLLNAWAGLPLPPSK
jgi:uncharacterized SAM-binding protein YcdF (DUF218 family)